MKEISAPDVSLAVPFRQEAGCGECGRRILIEEKDLLVFGRFDFDPEALLVYAICFCGGKVHPPSRPGRHQAQRILALPQNRWWKMLFR